MRFSLSIGIIFSLCCAVLLAGCTKYTGWEFQRQIFVPNCRIDCTLPDMTLVKFYTWGEDESGNLVCHAQPNGFTGYDGKTACKRNHTAYCDYALGKFATENPGHDCQLGDSIFFSSCVLVNENEYEQGKFVAFRTNPQQLGNFPECDVIIEHD